MNEKMKLLLAGPEFVGPLAFRQNRECSIPRLQMICGSPPRGMSTDAVPMLSPIDYSDVARKLLADVWTVSVSDY